ncbi:MAG: helix-turn-helix transcriptional regulator [Sandaracinaceae bacterium]|nr:MAG: XRE family transcriptional regulator [Sandaracinaceae bacterium]
MDFERLASELLRALRGKRSQVAFSRRLGFKSNVAYAWESGRRFPTAAEAMHAAVRCGHTLDVALLRYRQIHLGGRPLPDLEDPDDVAAFMRLLSGSAQTAELARRCGKNRHAVARWLSGETRVRLPDFLRFLQAVNRSALTFIDGFVSPATLPSAREQWARVQAMGSLLFDRPETLLVFVALGLATYRELPRHRAGWLAAQLGLTLPQERAALSALRDAGVIAWTGRRWRIDDASELDTRRYPQVVLDIKRFFAELGAQRIGARGEAFNYVLLSVEEHELEELLDMQRELIGRIRALAVRDRKATRPVLVNIQVAPLDAPDEGRLRNEEGG